MILQPLYTVKIKELLVLATHGVFEEEKHKKQPFVITADISYFPTGNVNTHHVKGEGVYLCYAELCDFIKETVEQESVGLLETLCKVIADKLFAKYPTIESARVAISKPEAIMDHTFVGGSNKQVSVEVFFPRVREFILSLGTNLGDRMGYLKEAVRLLNLADGVEINGISSIYETAAWGDMPHQETQPDFLNCCIAGETSLSAIQLLQTCQNIEDKLGRVRSVSSVKWQDRTIDIDIILIEGVELETNVLTVPHKHMLERAFVLLPLTELLKKRELSIDDKGAIRVSQEIDTQGVHLKKDLKIDV